jgi:hypothetical protein
MRGRTATLLLTTLLVGAFVAGCGQPGERTIEYEYVYHVEDKPPAAANPLSLASSPSMGPENAKVTIVEVSDFQ